MFAAGYGLLAATAAYLALCQPAFAEPPPGPGARSPEQVRSMRPEERRAAREQWQQMSPEDSAAKRQELGQGFQEQRQNAAPGEREERRQALRERWQSMSPEERESMKQRFRDQRRQGSPEEREEQRQGLRERWLVPAGCTQAPRLRCGPKRRHHAPLWWITARSRSKVLAQALRTGSSPCRHLRRSC